MRIGVVTFPGSLDDRDAARAVRSAGGEPVSLWHGDAGLHRVDAVVLPGGFSYGDYLRSGAMAARSPIMRAVSEAAGRGVPVLGVRNGFQVLTDAGLLRMLSSHIGRRVMPELRKAFAYEAKRFEGFKIGCYDAEDAGFFTAHRDNLSPATAHRRFGLTLNLNDDYEGGELRFPEYGPERYRPGAREALVFSGAHLHEVLPVTQGRRFVLLSFVFGDEPTGS